MSTYEIIDPKEVGIDDSSIVLTARSGRAALKDRLERLGINVDSDQLAVIYEKFLDLADNKKDITDEDIFAIAGKDSSMINHLKLEYLQVTSGIGIKNLAVIGLKIGGKLYEASAAGNGPVDAVIKAIREGLNRQSTIEDMFKGDVAKKIDIKEFLIQAINKGSDDVGKVHMQLEYDGAIYYGFSANTDIVTASAEAFINAVNKFINS